MRLLLLLPFLLVACDARASTTTVYDASAQAAVNYWAGLFWITVAIATAVSLVVWAICWAIVERSHR